MGNYTDDFRASQSTQPPPWFDSAPLPDEVPQTSDEEVQPEAPNSNNSDFNSADFMVPDEEVKALLSETPDVSQNKERQYITTHTPHAWLDRYIEYSRELSPRGFNALHEAAGLWVMSSVIAGRAQIFFGGRLRHTSLMFTAIARSSVWVKSHTIGLAETLLSDAGLDWLLLPSKASPQAIIEEMANDKRVVEILRLLDDAADSEALEAKLEAIRKELGMLYAHEGQRAWHISEFGSKIIAGMMRPGSVLADFSDFLRDINEKVGREYTYRTRGHGKETIESPYLTIIADTTPADIRPYAKVGAPLWSNGFFPRFAIIAPTSDEIPSKARVPYKYNRQPAAPCELTSKMAEVNQKLGRRSNYQQPLIKTEVTYGPEIWEAIYNYEKWVDHNRLDTEDLDGTYARLVFEQSVSIASTLAIFDDSFSDGSFKIEMNHYQRAVEICERIRRCTEDFYIRMTENPISEKEAAQSQLEDRIIKIIQTEHEKKNEWPTLRDIRKRTGSGIRGRLSREDIMRVMEVLRNANLLEEFKEDGKRAYRYRLISV